MPYIAVIYSEWVHTFDNDVRFYMDSPDYEYIGSYVREEVEYHQFVLRPLKEK